MEDQTVRFANAYTEIANVVDVDWLKNTKDSLEQEKNRQEE